MSDGGNAKIRKQHLLSSTQQHVLRLDIAVNKLLFMRILQGISHLLDRRDNHRERDQAAFRVATPQRPIGGIVNHQKGHSILHIIIEDTHDPGMHECRNGLRFLLEMLSFGLGQMRMQHLDRAAHAVPGTPRHSHPVPTG